MAESKLEAARRSGDLTKVMGALREQEQGKTGAIVSDIDASFGTVANPQLIAVGMMRDLGATDLGAGEGKTVIVDNRPVEKDSPKLVAARRTGNLARVIQASRTPAAARKLTRQEMIGRVKAWASTLTEEQRTEYMIGEKYGALNENAQDVIAEAFGQVDEQEASATDLTEYNFDTELVDVEALPADDDDEADAELDGLGETDYDELFNQTGWEQA
jgi:hypothetical protein